MPTALRGMTSWTVTTHWLYCRRFLNTLMDDAVLLLTTAAMPACGPTVGPFGPSAFGGPGGRAVGCPVPVPGRLPNGVVVVVSPGMACSSSGDRYRKSPSVRGSLYFLRRNFSRSSTSTLGGNALAYFRWYSATARAYCPARKMSSASFSRCTDCFHTGITRVQTIPMMAMPASSTAMAYPASGRARVPY
jgi:hypothetical protein